MEDIRDNDKVEEEEDLVEAGVRLSGTTAEHQGTAHRSVKIRHTHHVNTTASLTTL